MCVLRHLSLLTFRSVVRLALGNYTGALEDAKKALTLAPEYAEVS